MKFYSSLALAGLLATTATAAPAPELYERQDGGSCGLPAGYAPAVNAKLPDPFVFANGTKLTSKSQWSCHRDEILQMFYKYELGDKPGKPTSVDGTVSSSSITVTVTDQGKTASFSATVKMNGCSSKCPAIITIGGSSLPIPNGVATINFPNDSVGSQASSTSRGQGKFYDIYGKSATAGAMMAWAWGVSRLIDVLEAKGTDLFDVTKLGTTGCSRNGKGAFVVGAFDERIALTLPQESGSGGAACWRISDSQKAAGKNIQTAGEIVGENVWLSTVFNQYTSNTGKLPHDHHMLAGLVAPRGLLVIENDIDWLGPVSTTGCMRTGALIYQGLGASDKFGFSLASNHAHCSFPSAQQPELTAYINKFLLGKDATTSGIDKSANSAKAADYISWTAPTLT